MNFYLANMQFQSFSPTILRALGSQGWIQSKSCIKPKRLIMRSLPTLLLWRKSKFMFFRKTCYPRAFLGVYTEALEFFGPFKSYSPFFQGHTDMQAQLGIDGHPFTNGLYQWGPNFLSHLCVGTYVNPAKFLPINFMKRKFFSC